MSCLLGKLPKTKINCRESNLCQGHSKLVSILIESPTAQKAALEDDHHHENGSQIEHPSHEHGGEPQGHAHHHPSTFEHEEEPIPDAVQQHTSCEAHIDLEQAAEETNFEVGVDMGMASLESCCIDDSVRFFSTPTYFQSNDAIASLQVPLIVFCELPREVLLSFEEKTASFKPPENEALPTFSRYVRFQVFLI